MNVETQIHLNRFKPRWYQARIMDAIENKGYKRVLAVWPRRAGKDMVAWQLAIRQCIKFPCNVFYLFPTYNQCRKVIWDSRTNDGVSFLDFIPRELVAKTNGTELKVTFTNGSVLQLVGSDNFDCFDDQTEILTEDGWKLFKDLTKKERIATYNLGELSYELPLQHVEYDYDGLMYAAQNSSLDFKVTPNHRFFVVSSRGKAKFKEISDPTIVHDKIPSTSTFYGSACPDKDCFLGYNPEDFMTFIGFYLSEGSVFRNEKCYRVTISQIKPDTKSKIRDLLTTRMGLNVVEHKSGFNIENKDLYEYCAQFGKQVDRFIPKDLRMQPPRLLRYLFDALILGDGHQCKTYTAYYSISKRLVDDVQEIIIKLGYSGNVSIKKQGVSMIRGRVIKSKHTLYEVRLRTSKFKRLQGAHGKPYIKQVQYKGKVYCVSVPSGIIKVRRNGKEMWSGNSLMGTNPAACIFSEWALQDERSYQFLRPALTARDGWALFITTPRGKNHAYSMYQIAQQSPEWYCSKLTVEDIHHIPLSVINKEKADGIMSEDLILQEYYTSFDMGVEGAYYARYMDKLKLNNQIGHIPWENGFKVHTAWDLGMRDNTSIIFFQVIGQTIRIIDCYEKNKEGLEHYVKLLESKPYSYRGRHLFPFDVKVRELGSGISRLEKLRQLGIKGTVAPDASIPDGVEAVRSSLNKMWFDAEKCAPLIKALENYRQEYDVKKKVYKSQPLHDWSSHFCDAMRYLCLSLPKLRDGMSPEDLENNYREAMYGSQHKLPAVFRDPKKGYW